VLLLPAYHRVRRLGSLLHHQLVNRFRPLHRSRRVHLRTSRQSHRVHTQLCSPRCSQRVTRPRSLRRCPRLNQRCCLRHILLTNLRGTLPPSRARSQAPVLLRSLRINQRVILPRSPQGHRRQCRAFSPPPNRLDSLLLSQVSNLPLGLPVAHQCSQLCSRREGLPASRLGCPRHNLPIRPARSPRRCHHVCRRYARRFNLVYSQLDSQLAVRQDSLPSLPQASLSVRRHPLPPVNQAVNQPGNQ
jgi:hypothetical protein